MHSEYIILFLVIVAFIYIAFPTKKHVKHHVVKDDRCESMSNLMINNGYAVKSYGYVENDCDCDRHKLLRHIQNVSDLEFAPNMPWLAQHNLLPWWNSSRNTRNMSYDIRGDVPLGVQFVPTFYASPQIGYK
jgi:hypothetical protein